MKFFYKLLCLVIAGALFLPYTAFAENNNEDGDIVTVECMTLFSETKNTSEYDTNDGAEEGSGSTRADALTNEEKQVLEYIAEHVSMFETTIELPREYQIIGVSRFDTLCKRYLVYKLQFEHPDAFFLNQNEFRYSFSYRSGSGIVTAISIEYTIETVEEKNALQSVIDEEIDKIAAQTTGMTDIQKALFVHDYIVSNYHYDTRLYSSDEATSSQANRTLDKMIVDKAGVCQGYSYLYMVVMNKLGVECITVPTDVPLAIITTYGMSDHVWNKIKLDGEWYNVDLTYDDPIVNPTAEIPDRNVDISHRYFLQSDADIVAADLAANANMPPIHSYIRATNWDGTPSETSESEQYSDYALHNIKGNTAYLDDTFYCLNENNAICKILFDENELQELNNSTEAYRWYIYGSNKLYVTNKYSSITAYENKLYLNSPDKIYEFDTVSNELNEVYAHTEEDVSNTYFFGLRVTDKGLFAECCKAIITDGVDFTDTELLKISLSPCITPEIRLNPDTNEVTVSAPIPAKVKEDADLSGIPVTVIISKYDGDDFMGFEEVTFDADGSASFTPEENCSTIKVFIWAGFIKPLSEAATLTLDSSAEI